MAQLPYNIVKNEVFGRYMIATKKIKQGELILKELPKLVGPQINGALICFKCCKNLSRVGHDFCTECQKAVVCKKPCQGIYHTPDECSTLKSLQINGDTVIENDQILFALRCILLQKYDPELFQKIMELEPHLEKRRNTFIWRRNKFVVEKILLENGCLEPQDVEDELVQKICGILDVNTFEIRAPSIGRPTADAQCLRGLYMEAAMMAHDCLANTHLSVDDDFTLTIYAAVNIEEGSPIYFNYANVLQGTFLRKEHLREGKYFECACTRCKDPTELGTELSSLRCHKCHKGLIRASAPEKVNSQWNCNACQSEFKENLIIMAVDEARRKIEDVDPVNIEEMEVLLKRLLQTFHSNHYLVLELVQNMIGAYSLIKPNKNNLSRKIELCQQILAVFNTIEPGLSRIRAISLYQLQSAIVSLSHKQYRDSEINIDAMVTELLSAESILKESVKLLLYEPTRSPEGRMRQTALQELKMLRLSIGHIQRDFLDAEENIASQNRKSKVGKENYVTIDTPQKLVDQEVSSNKEEVASKRSRRRKNKNK